MPAASPPDPATGSAPPLAALVRPGLDPWRVGAWVAELVSVPVGLVEAYVPISAGIDARTREQLIITVSESNGAYASCWLHGSWLEFLGTREPDEVLSPLFAYARSCADAGVPLDTTTLEAVYPAAVVRSVRATVATAHLGSFASNSLSGLAGRLRGRPGPGAGSLVSQAVAMGLTLPLMAPTAAVALALRAFTRLAPEPPAVELPPGDEGNLVAHLLAEATPTYLGNVALRTGAVWSPVPVTLAVRIEGVAASIRVGRGRITIENGIHPESLVIVDGGSEPLLRLVAGSIVRELTTTVRRRA